MKTPKMYELYCRKMRGGKKPLWNAFHKWQYDTSTDRIYQVVVGAGNTADNAIKDYQKQFRAYMRNHTVKP